MVGGEVQRHPDEFGKRCVPASRCAGPAGRVVSQRWRTLGRLCITGNMHTATPRPGIGELEGALTRAAEPRESRGGLGPGGRGKGADPRRASRVIGELLVVAWAAGWASAVLGSEGRLRLVPCRLSDSEGGGVDGIDVGVGSSIGVIG